MSAEEALAKHHRDIESWCNVCGDLPKHGQDAQDALRKHHEDQNIQYWCNTCGEPPEGSAHSL